MFLALTGRTSEGLTAMRPMLAMIRKDLQLFLTDRRAVIMSLVAPIAIASFFGSIFSGGGSASVAKIPVADGRPGQQRGLARHPGRARADDKYLTFTTPTADEARDGVKRGTITVAVVIPAVSARPLVGRSLPAPTSRS